MPEHVTKRCLVCWVVVEILEARYERMVFKMIYCSVEWQMKGWMWQ